MLISIRGATTVTRNCKNLVLQATEDLLMEILEINNLNIADITSVFFSCTRDLDKVYPAVAARKLGLTQAALMCFDELYVENSLPLCIRVMINAHSEHVQSQAKHVYREKAKTLRPDIIAPGNNYFSIAIDGPSGAGKSTVAKLCAQKLDFFYVDTGAMYRAFAYYCIKNDIDITSEYEIDRIVEESPIEAKFSNGVFRVFSEGIDITDKIRTQQVADSTSKISAMESVRKKLVKMQRELAAMNNVVMDGRDIGSVVLKDSPLKIYLDASKELRAKRRVGELQAAGISANYHNVLKEIEDRDFRDMNRQISPLIKCADAIVIDNENLSADEVCAIICTIVRLRNNI